MAVENNVVDQANEMVNKMRHAWVRSGDAPETRNSSFLPKFDFNNKNGLLNAHAELMLNDGDALPVSPDPAIDINAILTDVKTQIQTQQANLLDGFGFNTGDFNKAIAAAKTAVEKSAAADASVANLKACNKVTENLQHMQEEVLVAEMEGFAIALQKLYTTANNERVYDQMMSKYGEKSKEMLWEKLTDFDDDDLQDELDAMNDAEKDSFKIEDGSNKEFLKKQKDGKGVYRAPGSSFNILLQVDENGQYTCQATLAAPQPSQLRQFTNIAIDVAELYVRAPTIPFQAALAFLSQMTGFVNKETGAPKIPYPTMGTFTRSRDSSPANLISRKAREQMDFMAMKAQATSITYDIPVPREGRGVTEYFVRNTYLALMEAEKRAGFNEHGTPKVKFPDAAMLFELSESLKVGLATSNSIKGVLPEVADYMRLHGSNDMSNSVKFLLQRIQKLNLAIRAQQEMINARAASKDEQASFKKALHETPAPTPTFPAPAITPAAALAKAPTPSASPKKPVPESATPISDALASIRAGKKIPGKPVEPEQPIAAIRAGRKP